MDRIYLDHNATTPLDPRVLDAMLPVLREGYGNPSSLHWFGQQARALLDEARARVARLIGATPSEIVFTGSGTEADNMALRGVLGVIKQGQALGVIKQGQAAGVTRERRKIVYSAIEHHAIMNTAKALAEEGWPVEVARVGADGRVDLDDLRARVDDTTAVVAVMAANNETGVIQPVAEVARIAHDAGALFHCDAVQAAGKIPVDVRAMDADTLALSAHKFYGPKGVGMLYVKRGTRLKPWVRGGSQERNRRSGTENVAGIVGLGRAAALAADDLSGEAPRLAGLRDRLEQRLLELPGSRRNGDGPRVPNTANISFEGIEAESLLMALDLAGIAVSTGAACAAGAVEPSHVLRGMGLPVERVQGSIRLSLGRSTTAEAINRAAEAIAAAVTKQRAVTRQYAARR